jgi:tetratricopeptide (TPR) repeat protein
MEPGKIRGAMGVVQVFMAQDKPADAIAFLQGEIEKNPKRVDVRVLLGDTLLRAGRPATALAEFQKALDGMDFQSASELYVRRGPLPGSYVRGRTDAMVQQALAVLGGQDATPKGSAGIYVRIAEVRITQRDFDWAIEALLKARASQPRDPIVLFNLAVVLEAGRRISEAIEAYRATLAVDPNNAIALNNLAFVLAENKGSLDEAWRYGKHAAELRPESSDIVDTLGWVALKKGWARDAAALFAQALVQQPRKADYRRHLLLALARKPRLPSFAP